MGTDRIPEAYAAALARSDNNPVRRSDRQKQTAELVAAGAGPLSRGIEKGQPVQHAHTGVDLGLCEIGGQKAQEKRNRFTGDELKIELEVTAVV